MAIMIQVLKKDMERKMCGATLQSCIGDQPQITPFYLWMGIFRLLSDVSASISQFLFLLMTCIIIISCSLTKENSLHNMNPFTAIKPQGNIMTYLLLLFTQLGLCYLCILDIKAVLT